MPGQFVFKIGDDVAFSCVLTSEPCKGFKAGTDVPCKRKCLIPFEYCSTHLRPYMQLRVGKSTLPNAGLGLFAAKRKEATSDVVFKREEKIAQYDGELISTEEGDRRYDLETGPYLMETGLKQWRRDAACKRCVASIANGKAKTYANARISPFKDGASIKATKVIKDGEEVFLDYGQTYVMHPKNSSYVTRRWVKKSDIVA